MTVDQMRDEIVDVLSVGVICGDRLCLPFDCDGP
jgi:hypothetical protein